MQGFLLVGEVWREKSHAVCMTLCELDPQEGGQKGTNWLIHSAGAALPTQCIPFLSSISERSTTERRFTMFWTCPHEKLSVIGSDSSFVGGMSRLKSRSLETTILVKGIFVVDLRALNPLHQSRTFSPSFLVMSMHNRMEVCAL